MRCPGAGTLPWLKPAFYAVKPRHARKRMRQRLALIAIEKNDIASFGLLAQLQTQANPIDLVGYLPPFQGVPRPPVTKLLLSQRLGQLRTAMRTPRVLRSRHACG
jgi:hypothetical protein